MRCGQESGQAREHRRLPPDHSPSVREGRNENTRPERRRRESCAAGRSSCSLMQRPGPVTNRYFNSQHARVEAEIEKVKLQNTRHQEKRPQSAAGKSRQEATLLLLLLLVIVLGGGGSRRKVIVAAHGDDFIEPDRQTGVHAHLSKAADNRA